MTRKTGRTTKVASLDLNTGEIMDDGIMVYVKGKARWHEDWCMLMQEAIGKLASDKDMSGETWRVWGYLMSRLGFENWLVISQSEVAESLGIRRPHVSRAMKKLIDKEVIVKGPKVGRYNAYKISSQYVWKGTIQNLTRDRKGELKIFKDELEKRAESNDGRKKSTVPRIQCFHEE